MASAWGEYLSPTKLTFSHTGFYNGQASYFNMKIYLYFQNLGIYNFFNYWLRDQKCCPFSDQTHDKTKGTYTIQSYIYCLHISSSKFSIHNSYTELQVVFTARWSAHLATGVLHCRTSLCINSAFGGNSISLEHWLTSLEGFVYCS